jgi:predicted amidohydrolase YtcJ
VPLEAIQTAVTRRGIADSTNEALLPEQAIDLLTALRAYTLGSARALGIDNETGSVTVGKQADLVVLGSNVEQAAPAEIAGVPVVLTLVNGAVVYGRLEDLAR